MKDLKKTFTQQFATSAVATALVVALMTVPFLEGARSQAANAIGLPTGILWLPAALLIVGFQYLAYLGSLAKVAKPFRRLLLEAENGWQGMGPNSRSKTDEENGIKHAFDDAAQKARSASEQSESLAAELEKTKQALDEERTRSAKLQDRFDEIESSTRTMRVENETLKAAKTALELTLQSERKSKVGAEVEKRTDEIYAQMERAVSAAAFKSIWVPSLVHELRTPISIINELSSSLSGSLLDRSLKEIEQEIEAIVSQSRSQLDLLNDILERQPPAPEQEPADEPAAAIPTPEEPVALSAEPEPIFSQPEPDSELEEAPYAVEAEPDFAAAVAAPEPDAICIEPDPAPAIEPVELDLASEPEAQPVAFAESDVVIEPDFGPTSGAAPLLTLEEVLVKMADEFSAKYADIFYSVSIDKELEIELEDPILLRLLRTLTEAASQGTEEGEIVLGAELEPDRLLFDVVSNGRLKQAIDPVLIGRADQDARHLGGEIEVEATSANELHLGFVLQLGDPETTQEPADLKQVSQID